MDTAYIDIQRKRHYAKYVKLLSKITFSNYFHITKYQCLYTQTDSDCDRTINIVYGVNYFFQEERKTYFYVMYNP